MHAVCFICECFSFQIFFLQETVRKECEERFELTEALSAAKEELLAFKRPAGQSCNKTCLADALISLKGVGKNCTYTSA